ncbi:helix-turn-helix domain-containing protein [Modestobacter caceresii]|uniref:helix-turn-helix domain-containing protein n=1 Tax=Modestobacter caceresii TaxID=1522368 RepID=UPI001E4BF3B0|nr:helix-turn-helix domain-containing protein [Modestobacter caceresii]
MSDRSNAWVRAARSSSAGPASTSTGWRSIGSAFPRRHGLPPHRYLTGRRVDLARRLLLEVLSAAEVASTVGFTDQSHLTRHFRRMIATTPAAYARSAD